MTRKERILATLNRQPTDRAPVDLWHTPEIGAALRQHFNVTDDLDVYRALGLDKIAWVSFYEIYCQMRGMEQAMMDLALEPEYVDAVLNPIQHVCPGMDMAELKKAFGDRVIFHGGVDNQSVLPFGTPEIVRTETRDCLATLGAGGQGYICCSCHNVQAGTPLENIFAMVETVQNGSESLALRR